MAPCFRGPKTQGFGLLLSSTENGEDPHTESNQQFKNLNADVCTIALRNTKTLKWEIDGLRMNIDVYTSVDNDIDIMWV